MPAAIITLIISPTYQDPGYVGRCFNRKQRLLKQKSRAADLRIGGLFFIFGGEREMSGMDTWVLLATVSLLWGAVWSVWRIMRSAGERS
jgi:hypothetical protein